MRVVLHICCGVCAAGVVERLISEGYEVIGLFGNPNIHPEPEYRLRLEAAYEVARRLAIPLVEIPYAPEAWFREASVWADEPEGGRRCEVCFRLRLRRAFLYMQENGGDAFTTTLTVSPHKAADVINRIGREIGGDRFLERDFKQRDGYKRARELAREWSLYHQNYCGCIYSMPQ